MKTYNLACLLIFLLTFSDLWAQQTGRVNYDQLGISFTIPENWVGQENNGMFLMGSNSVPGLILLIPSEYTNLEMMRSELKSGYRDAMGTQLDLSGSLKGLAPNTIAGEYSGTLEGQSVKAYVIGLFNDLGKDLVIISVTTPELYTNQQIIAAKAVHESVQFARAIATEDTFDWQYQLSGVRLTYMDTYYSSSYTEGGISGGYSTELKIDMCSEGYFKYYASDQMTAGGNFSSAYSNQSEKGSGTWKVQQQDNGNALLILTFHNGQTKTYQLERKDKKIFLNGKRYYRTWTGEYAPNCP